MDFGFGKKLKELRIKKDVTQEQLASHLKITGQSVSKWERGEGYPDITMLPRIALYFGVTTDELLGISEERIKADIEEYEKRAIPLCSDGEIEKRVALWREAHEKYPNEMQATTRLMQALFNLPSKNGDASNLEEAIALGEEILEKSTNSRQRNSAIQILCFSHSNLGDAEKAKEYANMGGNPYITAQQLLAHALKDDEQARQCRHNFYTYFHLIHNNIIFMNVSNDEKIELHEKMIELWKFACEGKYLYCAFPLEQLCARLSRFYLKKGDKEKALYYLEQMKEYDIIFDTEKVGEYTSVFFRGIKQKPENISRNYTGTICAQRLGTLNESIFDEIRNDERFTKVKEELQAYAQ